MGGGSFFQGFICKDPYNPVCMQTCRKEIKTISYIEKAYLSLCFFQLSLLTPSASVHDWQLIALPISSLFSCQVIQSCCHLGATRLPWGAWPHSAMEQSLPAPQESTTASTAWTQLPGDFQRGELHIHQWGRGGSDSSVSKGFRGALESAAMLWVARAAGCGCLLALQPAEKLGWAHVK